MMFVPVFTINKPAGIMMIPAGLLLLLACACHRQVLPSPAIPGIQAKTESIQPVSPAPVPEGVVLVASLEKTPCYGSCPVFQVSVYADGSVYWNGIRNVSRMGLYHAPASSAWLSKLFSSAKDAGFAQMKPRYPVNNQFETGDLPSTRICFNEQKGRDPQCISDNGDAPLALQRLEKKFMAMLEALNWQRTENK